ncbi:hypothetical protein HYPSUDRAFT_121788, partial [Hypholoma sublateritium FD-334 SS-4]
LYLTKRKGTRMEVDESKMYFKCDGTTLFTATVTSQNTGILDALTQVIPEFANASSTLPMDINLWHHCCAYHSYALNVSTSKNATIKQLIQGNLVIGIIVSLKNQANPICEACLAGKMMSAPFPSSDNHSEHPLELVHSDLGPV